MRLYEDDKEELGPSFSFGDEKDAAPRIHEDGGERYYEDRLPPSRDPVSRVQTKLNLVSIIIPLIVTVAIVVMYFQIKKELTTIQDSGATELKNLSAELQQKVTGLETKLAAIEQKMNADLETNGASLKELGTKIQSKADKKDFDAFNAQATSKLEGIQKSAAETASATAEKIKKEVESSVGQMQTSVNTAVKSVNDIEKNIKSDIDSLKGSVSEATSTAKAAQKEAASVKSAGYASSDDIKKEAARLEARIKDLEQKIAKTSSAKAAPAPAPVSTPAPAPQAKAKAPAPSVETKSEQPAAKHKTEKPAASDPVETYEEPPLIDEEAAPPAKKPAKSKGGINEQNL